MGFKPDPMQPESGCPFLHSGPEAPLILLATLRPPHTASQGLPGFCYHSGLCQAPCRVTFLGLTAFSLCLEVTEITV